MTYGEVLLSLTERALELMIPVIGHRMKFFKLITELKKKIESGNPVEVNEVPNELVNDGASTSNEAVCDGASFSNCENEEFQENVQQISCQTRCVGVKELILGRLWFCKTKFFKATKFCFLVSLLLFPVQQAKYLMPRNYGPEKFPCRKIFDLSCPRHCFQKTQSSLLEDIEKLLWQEFLSTFQRIHCK